MAYHSLRNVVFCFFFVVFVLDFPSMQLNFAWLFRYSYSVFLIFKFCFSFSAMTFNILAKGFTVLAKTRTVLFSINSLFAVSIALYVA